MSKVLFFKLVILALVVLLDVVLVDKFGLYLVPAAVFLYLVNAKRIENRYGGVRRMNRD